MGRVVVIGFLVTIGLAPIGCSSSGSPAAAATTAADETAAVCQDAVIQAQRSSADIEQSLLDLTAARATRDSAAVPAIATKIADGVTAWSSALAELSHRRIEPATSEIFDERVTMLDRFSDDVRTRVDTIIPGEAIDYVEKIANDVYMVCGQTPPPAQ